MTRRQFEERIIRLERLRTRVRYVWTWIFVPMLVMLFIWEPAVWMMMPIVAVFGAIDYRAGVRLAHLDAVLVGETGASAESQYRWAA